MGVDVVVVGAAVVRDGMVLAAQRADPPELRGLWEFPGGKVEPGESEQDALVRECREELGCELAVGEFLGETGILDGRAVLRVWLASVADGEPEPVEHLAVRWLAADDLLGVEWIPADLPLVSLLADRLRAGSGLA